MAQINTKIYFDEFIDSCSENQISYLLESLIDENEEKAKDIIKGKNKTSTKCINSVYMTVDINPQEFIDNCDKYEEQELTNYISDNIIDKEEIVNDYIGAENNFDYALISLIGKKNLLTKDQENYIINLSKNN